MKTQHFMIFTLAVLAIAAAPSPAQNPQTVQQLEARVQQLEAQNALLKETIEFKKTILDSAYAQRARAVEAELKEKANWAVIFAGVIAFVGLSGLFGFPIWIKKKAQEAADKKYDQFFADEKSRVLKVIEEKDEVVQLKKAKRILVLTPQGGSESFLRGFFLKEAFKAPTYANDQLKVEY